MWTPSDAVELMFLWQQLCNAVDGMIGDASEHFPQ
jgi:hypothetical protein